jgi:allantoinase
VIQADIAVEQGTISAIGPDLPGCARELEAQKMTIFPGVIDVHVHFNEPGREQWEGIGTGSRALSAGGGTLFFDMPLNSSPCTLDAPSFDAKLAALTRHSVTDFALWGGLVPGNRGAMDELAERGIIGFKAFMADSGLPEFPRADDLTLLDGMRTAARLNLPVAVHAESEDLTKALAFRIRQAGGRGIRDYLESRPVLAELEAIERAILFASETGARLHIVHISSGRGVAMAAEAFTRGVDVSIETCPHYLFFTDEDMVRIGAAAKCAPPLRPESDREALWTNVLGGQVHIIASDHSPSTPELKQQDNFFAVWGGIAGVQTTLAVLLDAGHRQRGLPLEQIANLTASGPARRFGIGRKGSLAVGQDADFVLVDLRAAFSVQPDTVFYRHKLSPYFGSTLIGTPRRTVLRGETIFDDGKFTSNRRGKLVRPLN